jgi:hypothetical protein
MYSFCSDQAQEAGSMATAGMQNAVDFGQHGGVRSAVRHPKKEVQEAIEEITADGWFRLEPGAHWGVLLCGHRERDGCRLYVNATPQNPATTPTSSGGRR